MSILSYQTLLSIDIGSQHTRAWLFDNVSGEFCLTGGCQVQSTVAFGGNMQGGVWAAIENLQLVTQRRLLAQTGKPIIGQQNQEMGVDRVALSLSAGAPIKTAIVGLSDDGSLAGIRRLASMFYTHETLSLSLNDGLDANSQLAALMQADADLIILAGGSDGGASLPILSAVENIRLVYNLLPRVYKPQIVYAGNNALSEEIVRSLEVGSDLHLAGNIQPVFGKESREVAWEAMLTAFERIRLRQLPGLQALKRIFGVRVIPTAFAMGRMVKYLNKVAQLEKGVIALDVGAGSTTLVASREGHFVASLTRTPIAEDIGEKTCQWSWLPLDVETTAIYMQNKNLHPAFMASTLEDLAIEHAWTRVRLQDALARTAMHEPDFEFRSDKGLVGIYEPVILSGESLINVPSLGQTFLMALDALQPRGITTLVLDKDQLLAGLGSMASVEPLLPVQILDKGIFMNLGTVICVDSPAKEGTLVLTIELARDEGKRDVFEILKGSIKRYEVKPGVRVRLYLAPEEHADVGMGRSGLGGWVSVTGGELGVVIDARGRPINLPVEAGIRSDLIRNWLWELGG